MGKVREFNFITGVETSTAPTATDPSGDNDLVNKGYADGHYKQGQLSVADLTALKAIAAADRTDGDDVYVQGLQRSYIFEASSSATGDDELVVTPDAGTGRWLVENPNPELEVAQFDEQSGVPSNASTGKFKLYFRSGELKTLNDAGSESTVGGLTGRTVTSTTPYAASNTETIYVDSSAAVKTVNLPSSPSAGDFVVVADAAQSAQTNNITVGRNSSNIDSAASDYTMNLRDQVVEFTYIDGTIGWSSRITHFTPRVEQHTLSSDQTSTGVMTALTFNNLVVGNWYRIDFNFAMRINTGTAHTARIVIEESDGTDLWTVTGVEGSSGGDYRAPASGSFVYKATQTSVRFNAVTLSNASLSSDDGGNGDKTRVQLMDVLPHNTTTDFT